MNIKITLIELVEFEINDYKRLVYWFELAFGKEQPDKVSPEDKKTFWKLTFLAEDKIEENKTDSDQSV